MSFKEQTLRCRVCERDSYPSSGFHVDTPINEYGHRVKASKAGGKKFSAFYTYQEACEKVNLLRKKHGKNKTYTIQYFVKERDEWNDVWVDIKQLEKVTDMLEEI